MVHAALYGQQREGLKGTWRDGNILASRRMGLFSQPLPEGRGSHADSQLESRLPQETEDEPYLCRSEQDGFVGISRAGEFVL